MAKVKVGSDRGGMVVRESICDSGTLSTWFKDTWSITISMEAAILIKTSSFRIVLEPLAMGESNSTIDRIDRTFGYKNNLSSKEAWLVKQASNIL